MKTKIAAVLAISLALITLNSCKKKDVTPDTTATFIATVDGTVTDFNVNLKAWEYGTSPNWVTAIQGKTSNGMMLTISFFGTPIAGKTYSDADTNDPDRPFIVYQTPTTIASGDEYYNDHDDASNVPSVTITSLSSTTMDGTFKGRLINKTDTKLITDGKFHVNLQPHP